MVIYFFSFCLNYFCIGNNHFEKLCQIPRMKVEATTALVASVCMVDNFDCVTIVSCVVLSYVVPLLVLNSFMLTPK